MDSDSITEFLGNKTILITGATGFVAKILLEKILRIQPNVNKLYLLIRASDTTSANIRLQDEVFAKELFKVLKEEQGAEFETFVSNKVTAIAGDVSYETMGLADAQLQQMYENIDIIINVAATTKFDERYDYALGVNAIGTKHVVNFAKKCAKIQLLIHVSTAYVCGEKAGLIMESPYEMGETLNNMVGLDINSEKELVEQTLCNLKANQLPEKEVRQRMKDLGSQRAKMYGWPNTYVFTKAMGEMILGQLRDNLPVIIMRPTIVTSTLKEPFPGWVEGCRTIDSVIVSYGKGFLKVFCADESSVLDLVPADMFVNSIIVAMKSHVNQPCLTIYHVGSSFRNPMTAKDYHNFLYHYFTKNPWTNSEGKLVKIGKGILLSNTLILEVILNLWHGVVQLALILTNRMDKGTLQDILVNLNKKIKITKKLVDLYKPYVFFKGIFEDTNTEMLLKRARENGLDDNIYNFDTLCIDWKDYFVNIHLAAVVKYLF